jgi:hypothetical protein
MRWKSDMVSAVILCEGESRMANDKRSKRTPLSPQPGWAVYLRTNSDENQKPELLRERQRTMITISVLAASDMPVYHEYIDVLTGKDPRCKA